MPRRHLLFLTAVLVTALGVVAVGGPAVATSPQVPGPSASGAALDPAQVTKDLAAAQAALPALAATAATATAQAYAASLRAGAAAQDAVAAAQAAQDAAASAASAQVGLDNLASDAYRQGPMASLASLLTAQSPEGLFDSMSWLSSIADSGNATLHEAVNSRDQAAVAEVTARTTAQAAVADAAAALKAQADASAAVASARLAVAGLKQDLAAAMLAKYGLSAPVPVSGDLLARASALKDVRPFDPTAGPNANDRMPAWLASDRTVTANTPRAYAVSQLAAHGWGLEQWACLDRMWWHESGWSPTSVDRSQGPAFDPSKTWGIPQAFPASKMGDVSAGGGPDWITNPATQINWGLSYIARRYTTPCGAWTAWRARAVDGHHGWY